MCWHRSPMLWSFTSPVRCSTREYSGPNTLSYIYEQSTVVFRSRHSSTFLIADDTKCSKSINSPSDRDLLQADLDNVVNWSATWKLLFNYTKTITLISFGSKVHQFTTKYSVENNRDKRKGNSPGFRECNT